MKRTLIYLVCILGVLGMGIGLGTFAWFTSQASSENNVFETGDLIIGLSTSGSNDGFLTIDKLVPGQSISKTLDVRNSGDVVFKYKASVQKQDGDDNLFNKLQLTIKKGTTTIFDGSLKDLNMTIGNIDSGVTETLDFTATLPQDAGNEYQGKLATAKFIFDATQIENTTWIQ